MLWSQPSSCGHFSRALPIWRVKKITEYDLYASSTCWRPTVTTQVRGCRQPCETGEKNFQSQIDIIGWAGATLYCDTKKGPPPKHWLLEWFNYSRPWSGPHHINWRFMWDDPIAGIQKGASHQARGLSPLAIRLTNLLDSKCSNVILTDKIASFSQVNLISHVRVKKAYLSQRER